MHLTGWFNGDFNYDGVVDGSDYALADNAFNQQTAALAAVVAAPAASLSASPSEVLAGSAAASVPEPGVVGLLLFGSVGVLGRRGRRCTGDLCRPQS